MKTMTISLIALLTTACASSSSRLSAKVNDARTDVNATLGRVEAKARPAVRPVANRLDRGANQAAAKLGLRHRPENK